MFPTCEFEPTSSDIRPNAKAAWKHPLSRSSVSTTSSAKLQLTAMKIAAVAATANANHTAAARERFNRQRRQGSARAGAEAPLLFFLTLPLVHSATSKPCPKSFNRSHSRIWARQTTPSPPSLKTRRRNSCNAAFAGIISTATQDLRCLTCYQYAVTLFAQVASTNLPFARKQKLWTVSPVRSANAASQLASLAQSIGFSSQCAVSPTSKSANAPLLCLQHNMSKS